MSTSSTAAGPSRRPTPSSRSSRRPVGAGVAGYRATTFLAVMPPVRNRSVAPSPPATLPTGGTLLPRCRIGPGPGASAATSAASCMASGRTSGPRTVSTGSSRRTASRTSWATTSSGSARGSSTVSRTSRACTWPGRPVDGLAAGRRTRPGRTKAARWTGSENRTGSRRSATASGRWTARRSASSPGRNSAVADRPGRAAGPGPSSHSSHSGSGPGSSGPS